MSIPQHIIFGAGGTVSIDTLTRPTTAKVKIEDASGGEIVGLTNATISTISTTLSSAAAEGAWTIAVASATGISSGQEFWVRTPNEVCRCKSITSTTVTLWRRLAQAHASGSTVQGTRITYSVSAAAADSLFFDGRCIWTLDNAVAHYTSVECTRYPLARLATTEDLYREDPLFMHVLEDEADSDQLLDAGHEHVLSRIGAKMRARVFVGSSEFKRAAALAALTTYYRAQPSESGRELYTRYGTELEAEIARLCAVVPRDENQDGEIEASEQRGYRSVRLMRA